MSFGQAWQLVKESASAWVNDYASSMGAAIAYYTVFSIAPLLLIVIAVLYAAAFMLQRFQPGVATSPA